MQRTDIERLAKQFMGNAVKVKSGDNIWVEYNGPKAKELADECAKQVTIAGGIPHMVDSGAEVVNRTISPMSQAELTEHGEQQLDAMKHMQGYIRIKDDADQERITVPPEKMVEYRKAMRPMMDHRVNNTRWLVVAAPTDDFAKGLGMEQREFEKFYLESCLIDYGAMDKAVQPLKELMEKTDKVHIFSPNQETDLTFSIKGIPAVPCVGKRNIPDGECYTAPVKDSINGTIKFGPSSYNGQKFQFIKLRFEKGRAVEATAENPERTEMLNKMLDTDEGARYVGEFSLNFNPLIKHPTGNILFDEKIDGGIHMALGKAYDLAFNGNVSANHWDMVHIQRPDYGGGEIYFDDRLIRKDGIFVVPELLPLNPENLLAASRKSTGMNGPAA